MCWPCRDFEKLYISEIWNFVLTKFFSFVKSDLVMIARLPNFWQMSVIFEATLIKNLSSECSNILFQKLFTQQYIELKVIRKIMIVTIKNGISLNSFWRKWFLCGSLNEATIQRKKLIKVGSYFSRFLKFLSLACS